MFANKFFGFFGILFVVILTFSVLVTATTPVWADAPRVEPIETEPLQPSPPSTDNTPKHIGVYCESLSGEDNLANKLHAYITNSVENIQGSKWERRHWKYFDYTVYVIISRSDDSVSNQVYNPVELWNMFCLPESRINIRYDSRSNARRWTYWFQVYLKAPIKEYTEGMTYKQKFDWGDTIWQWVPNPKKPDMPFPVPFADRYSDVDLNGASFSSSNNGNDGSKWFETFGIIKRTILSIPLPTK